MLQFDQESGQPRRSAYGPSGSTGTSGRALDEIAREIEDSQRQQSETMANIVERLRTMDAGHSVRPRQRKYVLLDEAGDEPWDAEAAEELMQGYEATTTEPATQAAMSYNQQAWIGERFNDVTQRITQALSDLKPGPAVAVLEERLDAFQAHIGATLEDVARRSDLEGLRLIEVHVNDLNDKLNELERHVSRIGGIESDLRTVMQQVSDERIAKLITSDDRLAIDLETVARRAAEDVHARLGNDTAYLGERQDELRRLVEASVADRREAEAHAVSLVTTLSGRVNTQSDSYHEIKGLLETAIREQRQNEQTAISMLETLQQALVTVLDRMDVLDQQHQEMQTAAAATVAAAPAPAQEQKAEATHEPILGPPPQDTRSVEPVLSPTEPANSGEVPYTFRDTHFDGFGTKNEADDTDPVEVPAAFTDAASPTEPAASGEPETPLDRLRRDFIADARRAKMKATANRAEALGEPEPSRMPNVIAEARAALTQTEPAPASGGSGRLFGMSTKLLAGVLALIIAINGGLLLINRKSGSHPASPEIARPVTTEPNGSEGANSQLPTDTDATGREPPARWPSAGPRSDLGGDTGQAIPYGFHDDVFNPPEAAPTGGASELPHGMTITSPGRTLSELAVAGVYEQQVLASLSGQLGMIAAGQSASALLPEAHGRISTAYPAPELDPAGEGATSANRLELPPATVGPMSLRVAAANGDPSAEFEVAARLAEGNGTGQNYAEALRWYQRSAAKGFAQAQYRVGTLYERGLGVAKDLERAKIWYQRAAEGGNVKAMHNLAVLIAGGAQPDYAAAMPWFLKAAEHGLADSQYNLGVLLENGLGASPDHIGAYKWYALAAKSGDVDATQRRDALVTALSAEELASADGMIATYRARPASPLANDARTAGEDWKKRVNNDTNT